jgi:hypothetical protein
MKIHQKVDEFDLQKLLEPQIAERMLKLKVQLRGATF